jgi:hypothetical protein
VSWVSEWKLDPLPEFRAWYSGQTTVGQYHGNYAPRFKTEGPGTYDEDHNRIGDGVSYKFTYMKRMGSTTCHVGRIAQRSGLERAAA